jgi:hypothetical protein
MAKRTYRILVNGTDYGAYDGETEDEALDAMAEDAGYPGGFRALCQAAERDYDCGRVEWTIREVQS